MLSSYIGTELMLEEAVETESGLYLRLVFIAANGDHVVLEGDTAVTSHSLRTVPVVAASVERREE